VLEGKESAWVTGQPTGWVGLGWVGLGQNFSPSGGFDYVVGFSFGRLQKLTFYMLSIWSVKYSLRYSLSTRVIKYAVRVAIIIGFFTRE